MNTLYKYSTYIFWYISDMYQVSLIQMICETYLSHILLILKKLIILLISFLHIKINSYFLKNLSKSKYADSVKTKFSSKLTFIKRLLLFGQNKRLKLCSVFFFLLHDNASIFLHAIYLEFRLFILVLPRIENSDNGICQQKRQSFHRLFNT